MPVIAMVGVDTAGGTISASAQADPPVTIDGNPVSVIGDGIVPHPPCPTVPIHCAATMAAGSPGVTIDGVPICRTGDAASCGHPAVGSSDCTDDPS